MVTKLYIVICNDRTNIKIMTISLKKGNSIILKKGEERLNNICIGLNWGAIEKKQLFGLINSKISVDLDASVATFTKDKTLIDTVYYNSLYSTDRAIVHNGDDAAGDPAGDDGLDNEIIQIDLLKVNPLVNQIVFFLNSYKDQDFSDIPYSIVRIYEGDKNFVKEILATFNLSADPAYKGKVSMVIGKLVREEDNWNFVAIGKPVSSKKIKETIHVIQKEFLD